MKTFLVRSTLLSALICIPSAGFSDTLQLKDGREIIGHYEGGNSRVIRFRTDSGIAEYDLLRVSHIRISESASTSSTNQPAGNAFSDLGRSSLSFGAEQERLIRDWFSNRSNLSGLPPGLARRDAAMAMITRHIARNNPLAATFILIFVRWLVIHHHPGRKMFFTLCNGKDQNSFGQVTGIERKYPFCFEEVVLLLQQNFAI